jgi:hypothetical protein
MPAMADTPPSPVENAPPVAAITLWPADVLARHLVSDDPAVRTTALGMALQPGAPIDACVEALVTCAQRSVGDPLASQLAATAMGSLPSKRAIPGVLDSLTQFVGEAHSMPVRIAAAHALFRLASLPAAAHDPVCAMLLDADGNARKVALLAVTPFAREAAASIAKQVAGASPDRWTSEALHALARSAGKDNDMRGKLEAFVMRSLAGAPLMPTGIAGYCALAQLNPQGAAVGALVQVAADTSDNDKAFAALQALSDLGEIAQPAAKAVAQMLPATDDPAREEMLCRTLLRLKPSAKDLPLARVLQRVESAPDRACAAHCMLLCMHPKDFAPAAVVVHKRHAQSSAALQRILSQVHKTLAGVELTELEAESATSPEVI